MAATLRAGIAASSAEADPSSRRARMRGECARRPLTVVRYRVLLAKGLIVSAITATEARKNLFGLIQQVNDDHTTVEVVSRRGNAVIMSKEDFDALTETAYLLRNPANAERLLEAIERARRGEFEQHDLLDT